MNTTKHLLRMACCALPLLLHPSWPPAQAEAAGHGGSDQHQHSQPRSRPAPGSGRQYAPSRLMDILHLAVEVTPDFKDRSITGQVTLRFKPIAKPMEELRLDAVDLTVQSVSASRELLGWQGTAEEVILTFAQPIGADEEASVTVRYHARPDQGLYFRTPEMGYPAEDTHLWTQGEAIEARHWFPCYDFPNEKFTSEVTCRVPEGMVVLSNGRKVSEFKEPEGGLVAVRWIQDKPHVSYLITLVAGYFKKVEDLYRDIPLAFHTPASQIQYAALSFAGTKEMMAFFEEEIGVPYPWDKYDQVCVYDFTAGGMENTSQTTLHLSTLHTEATENLQSSQGLVAHELVHQWFGDLVTCKDWSHLWLNEGFATYYEALYDEQASGRDEFLYRLHQSGKMIASQPHDTNAIVRRDFKSPEEQFGYLAYPKGAWVLHMLRHQLGRDLYRRCIKTFVERHQFGTAETEDLIAVLEDLSGRSFDQFFDQYVYHAHHPELAVQYHWDEKTKLAKINVQQKQALSEAVLLFQVALPLRFKSKSSVVDREILVSKQSEDFSLPLPEAPELVRVDPELSLLAAIDFNPPTPMLYAQLSNPDDALGRLLAAEKLGAHKDGGAVARLKEALNEDSFYGVRLEAAQALRAIGSDEAFAALLSSTSQVDARVRQEVIRTIASFYREESYQAILRHLEQEKNPDIQAVLLRALGAYAKPEVQDRLLVFLKTHSFRNTLAQAAIEGFRGQDDPALVAPLLDYLQHHEADFSEAHHFGQALQTLAFLAREADDKSNVRHFLLGQLEHKKKPLRLAAIQALGTLRDPKALAALETLTRAPKASPERTAAEQAVAQLRQSRPVAPELNTLRTEVLDLQKQNRQLRQDFDDLKKKLESLETKRPPEMIPEGSAPAKGQ